MAVTLYKSTDASAPVLTGQVNSLVALLDAVLVNGYGAKAAAGWTKPFTAANKAAFKSSATGGTGFYLDVDDSGPNANNGARFAQVRGFETMSAVATGTGAFPTTAQFAAGIQILKSETADATANPWIVVADTHTFTLFVKLTGSPINGWHSFHFGDIFSLKTADAYRAIIIGRTVVANPGAWSSDEETLQLTAIVNAVATGHYMPRTYDGAIQAALQIGKHVGDLAKNVLVPYPNPADGSIMLSQFWAHEDVGNQGIIRGRLRGIWHFLHDPMSNVNDGDTFSGSGALAGKSFLVVKPLGGTLGVIRMVIVETSDTWETSA